MGVGRLGFTLSHRIKGLSKCRAVRKKAEGFHLRENKDGI